MERFLIVSPHTYEDCKKAIKYFAEFHANFLTHFEWGCMDNEHNAYAIVDAESHEQALLAVPPYFREKTKVIKLVQLKPEAAVELINEGTY